MVVDTSALIAILRLEPEAPALAAALAVSNDSKISAANYLEPAVVVDRSGDPVASRRFDELMNTASIRVVAFDLEQAEVARQAYRDYGKGTRHPAQLNFGDCFAYALARTAGEPLLFKGDDFSRTDIHSAL